MLGVLPANLHGEEVIEVRWKGCPSDSLLPPCRSSFSILIFLMEMLRKHRSAQLGRVLGSLPHTSSSRSLSVSTFLDSVVHPLLPSPISGPLLRFPKVLLGELGAVYMLLLRGHPTYP